MNTSGKEVISLLADARRDVLIVAPFIRSDALRRILDIIPSGVETVIVTRWRPADLIAGASDLGVFDIAESKAVPLYLRNDLHAKLFASDDKCLVGSANVTRTALGWKSPANLELLTPIDRMVTSITAFEEELFAGAVRATVFQRNHLLVLLEQIRKVSTKLPVTNVDNTAIGLLPANWIPRSRNPEDLYSVYSGNRDISRSVLRTMKQELKQIGSVPGLDNETFIAWVAAAIGQTPIVDWVIQRIENQGQVTESGLSELLTEIGVDTRNHQTREVLEVLKRWLTYFLPAQYETTQDSIKLIKARNV